MYQLIPPAPSPPPAVWAKFQPDVPNPFVLIYVSVYTGVYKNIIKSILSVSGYGLILMEEIWTHPASISRLVNV